MLEIKTAAPSFSLSDSAGQVHSLGDFLGHWVLVYFYPKDDTPGCTKEACSFRDNFPKFENLNIKILGISADSPDSHAKFINKYNLNFLLLSDPEKKVINAYGAGGVFVKRISYLVDPEGKIFKAYSKVDPAKHAEEVLADLPA